MILLGGLQENQAIKTDGISTCLAAAMGMGGGYVPIIVYEREEMNDTEHRTQNTEHRKIVRN